MDYEIRLFQEQLIAIVNQQVLPWEVRRLVLGDVYELVAKKAQEVINGQLASIEENKDGGELHECLSGENILGELAEH